MVSSFGKKKEELFPSLEFCNEVYKQINYLDMDNQYLDKS
ncbi:hypothetical protein NIES267_36740 [Calothrix parasitica NIES-267]|uniref:Uncharacterized protein n=1 Tax=Calothrix parasitica NIES-267 TaxID=1973488 RepID=A0A1Z4LSY0_9CYAN|nr:hypothetical protein NIES267_36740 [Calothrix parasitica NIES-267]